MNSHTTLSRYSLSSGFALDLDSTAIHTRLKQKLSIWEAASLGLCLGVAGFIIYIQMTSPGIILIDYRNYLQAGQGNFSDYFYSYHIVPFFSLLDWLPDIAALILWFSINIAGVWFAARVFGARPALVLASYTMLYCLYYGQITGIIAGGLGLLWLGLVDRRWWLVGLGLLITTAKFQTGCIFSLLLVIGAGASIRFLLKSLIFPVGAITISFLLYPNWIFNLLNTFRYHPPNALGNISLWQWIGPFSILLLVVSLLLPLARQHRLFMLFAATPLVMPYFQQVDLLILFVLPVGWWPLAGNLGFLRGSLGWGILRFLWIIPLGIYITAALKGLALSEKINSRTTVTKPMSSKESGNDKIDLPQKLE